MGSIITEAVTCGDIDLVRAIVNQSNVNNEKSRGFSLLILSVINDHYDVAEILIDAGANVNEHDPTPERRTALHWASWKGNLKIAKLLIDSGANVNAKAERLTPLDYARTPGMKNFLKSHGGKTEKIFGFI